VDDSPLVVKSRSAGEDLQKKRGSRHPTHSIMESLAILIYPSYATMIQRSRLLPMSSRSLIVKACQAQKWPGCRDDTLYRLISNHSTVPILSTNFSTLEYLDLINWAYEMDVIEALTDPLESSIILDIMRALPVQDYEIEEARNASWWKEIVLAEGVRRPSSIRWKKFFDNSDDREPIAVDLPSHPNMLRYIRRTFKHFRDSYMSGTREMWPRSTHKNMSRDTRRAYETEAKETLVDVPIFGQDNWQRYYESTGIQIQGSCEIRQNWPPAQVKPRTYFAMGGTVYTRCRHLQNFFTTLVNLFSPTHHVTRLRPQRLVIDPNRGRGDRHFFIYDLSNFTSNMAEHRYFVQALAEFFLGTEVMVMDEREGPICRDLGEMLFEYEETCVSEPLLTYERFDPARTDSVPHGIASLLGIFGNLMTCTLAHFLIVSSVADDHKAVNVAGDDGILPRDDFDNLDTDTAIRHVGSYAIEKSFNGDEDAPICLKRPFEEALPGCYLLDNLTPPPIALAAAYLNPYNVDPRYTFYGLEDMTKTRRISTLGKDLLRFLQKAWRIGYTDIERLDTVLLGFQKAVVKLSGVNILGPSMNPIWPCLPSECNGASPQEIILLYSKDLPSYVPRHEDMDPEDEKRLIYAGDEILGNSSQWSGLLSKLGYLEIYDEFEDVVTYDMRLRYWYSLFVLKVVLPPKVVRIVVSRDLPSHWLRT